MMRQGTAKKGEGSTHRVINDDGGMDGQEGRGGHRVTTKGMGAATCLWVGAAAAIWCMAGCEGSTHRVIKGMGVRPRGEGSTQGLLACGCSSNTVHGTTTAATITSSKVPARIKANLELRKPPPAAAAELVAGPTAAEVAPLPPVVATASSSIASFR